MAATPGIERVDVGGVPGWANGSFTIGGDRGTVRRISSEDAVGWDPDTGGTATQSVRVGVAARFGTIEYVVDSSGLGGRLEARCRYIRTEARSVLFDQQLAAPHRPLRLSCSYRLNGDVVGLLELGALRDPGAGVREPRSGRVTMNGVMLDIESVHEIVGTSIKISQPIGYTLLDVTGRSVAAVEINGLHSRRMLLPRSATQRSAAAAATLTLALFWDPGDKD